MVHWMVRQRETYAESAPHSLWWYHKLHTSADCSVNEFLFCHTKMCCRCLSSFRQADWTPNVRGDSIRKHPRVSTVKTLLWLDWGPTDVSQQKDAKATLASKLFFQACLPKWKTAICSRFWNQQSSSEKGIGLTSSRPHAERWMSLSEKQSKQPTRTHSKYTTPKENAHVSCSDGPATESIWGQSVCQWWMAHPVRALRSAWNTRPRPWGLDKQTLTLETACDVWVWANNASSSFSTLSKWCLSEDYAAGDCAVQPLEVMVCCI